MNDCISRQTVVDAIDEIESEVAEGYGFEYEKWRKYFCDLPPAQPTIYGYNVEHLELIARILQKENMPPERIVEVLKDIGRIVAIISDEFEKTLRKAVEQCMT